MFSPRQKNVSCSSTVVGDVTPADTGSIHCYVEQKDKCDVASRQNANEC